MEQAFGLKMLKKIRFLAFERFDKNALSSQFTFSKTFFFPVKIAPRVIYLLLISFLTSAM